MGNLRLGVEAVGEMLGLLGLVVAVGDVTDSNLIRM